MRRFGILSIGLAALIGAAERACGDIVQRTADLVSTVREFEAGTPTQSDIASGSFPGTSTTLPLPAFASLTGLDAAGKIEAAARAVTVFSDAAGSLLSPPDNVGMDLAAFAIGPSRSWMVEGSAMERRTIKLTAAQTQLRAGQKIRARSTLFLAGVLILSSTDSARDLTGATAGMSFRVTRAGSDGSSSDVLVGGATVSGGAGGSVSVDFSGAVDSNVHVILNLDGVVPQLPLLRVLIFTTLSPFDRYTYEYDAVVDEPFDLVLDFKGRLATLPSGVGAAVVFGLPQAGLDEVFRQVGGATATAGKQVQQRISAEVDTTGKDRPAAETIITPLSPVPAFPMCGVMGGGSLAVCATASCMRWSLRRRRRRDAS